MEKINIAELLKDCPKGMELDCTIFDGKVCFEELDNHNPLCPIKISVNLVNLERLDIWGQYDTKKYSKCVIFPKGKTTWEGFVPPCQFKDGDIVAYDSNLGVELFIFKEFVGNATAVCYLYLNSHTELHIWETPYLINRLATEEEKAKLFQAIKDNGYKWNPVTKTLEKLPKFKVGDKIFNVLRKSMGALGTFQGVISEITDDKYIFTDGSYMFISSQDNYELVLAEPKFKVGDRIRQKGEISTYTITDVNDAHYFCGKYVICDTCDDNWELVSNKFDITTLKPFDKVLVRCSTLENWRIQFFEKYDKTYIYPFICIGCNKYKQCIPYEGNEHLLDKTDDCNKYFKTTWQ
jgi:hypothetical protein